MKPDTACQYRDAAGACLQSKNGGRHYGHDADHPYEAPAREGFGSQRKPLNPRSERMTRYYADVRIPAIIEAIGDGRRPCTMRTPDCTGWVETLHEPATRGRFGGLQSAVEAGGEMPCCNPCNFWVKKFPIRAREMGLLRSNTVDGSKQPPRMPPRRGQSGKASAQ